MTSERLPSNLNLVLTYKCNLRCRHCIADCGPSRMETMTLGQATRYLDSAVAATDIGHVGYTGGEPFLFYNLMRSLMDYAYQTYGLPQGVVTNCSWATTPNKARVRLKELSACGLRNLTVSCDSFHLEFVSAEAIKYVVHAALELGLAICINSAVTRNGSVCKTNVPALLSLSQEDLEQNVVVKELGPLLVGRAAREISHQELIDTEHEQYFDGNCPYVIRTPTIAPDGSLFACCCFGDAENQPAEKIGYVGNVDEVELASLFESMENNLLFNLLANRGPYALLKMVLDRTPRQGIRGRYFCTCDICVELHHNPGIRRVLAQLLQQLAEGASGVRTSG